MRASPRSSTLASHHHSFFGKCQQPLALFACHRLDRGALPIKQLKGEESVESIDLSDKRLTVLSAVVISALIASNTATKSLK